MLFDPSLIDPDETVSGFTIRELAAHMKKVHAELGIKGDRALMYREWNDHRGIYPTAPTIQTKLTYGWMSVVIWAGLSPAISKSKKALLHPLDMPTPKLAEIGRRRFEDEYATSWCSAYRVAVRVGADG